MTKLAKTIRIKSLQLLIMDDSRDVKITRLRTKKKLSSGTLVALLLVLFVAWFASVKESPSPSKRTIRAKVLFGGKPITEITTMKPKFWFRNETKGAEVSPDAVYSNGEFEIPGLSPGQYAIIVQFDTNQSNPINYPGDLRASQQFTVSEKSNSTLQIEPLQIIHMVKPEDNGKVLRDWSRCCETGKPAHPGTLQLQWTSLGENVYYDYSVSRLGCPYQTLDSAATGTTQETNLELNLPPSNSKEYYLLTVHARKDGRKIGMLMTHGTNGYGWDYRFRIE